jgi:large subunit ribosomal protein L32
MSQNGLFLRLIFNVMGGVPKQKHTKSRRNKRRMHLYLEEKTLTPCLHCKALILPHTVCANCGFYKGVEVINVLAKLEKKERKLREKDIQEAQKEEKSQKPPTMEELSKQKF